MSQVPDSVKASGAALADLDNRSVTDPRLSVEAGPSGPERDQILSLINEYEGHEPGVLDRTCRPGHLTGSALVVDPSNRQVLVLFHAKLQRWLQPGGHADGDADLARVALREATEETGISGLRVLEPAIDLDVHVVKPPFEDAHEHHDVRFLVLAPPGACPLGNHESEKLEWVSVQNLAGLGADIGLLRLAKRGMDHLDHLLDKA